MSDRLADGQNDQVISTVEALEADKTPKFIRVLTVCAYLICVSLAAIMLSIYYIFLWEPKRYDPSTAISHGSGGVHRKH